MRIAILEHLLRVAEDRLFATAAELGFDGVELSFGAYDADERTILQPGGPARLREQADAAGVRMPSLSAGCFTRLGLGADGAGGASDARTLLGRLIDACAEAGVTFVHLPLFGASEVRTPAEQRRCVETLRPLVEQAAGRGVTLGFDVLLPAEELKQLVERFESPSARIGYDVGNARAAGRDVAAEIQLLGGLLAQVRVKDRDRREPFASVPLGEGAVHWKEVLRALKATGYDDWLVLDTPSSSPSSSPSGQDPLASARRNREHLAGLLERKAASRTLTP